MMNILAVKAHVRATPYSIVHRLSRLAICVLALTVLTAMFSLTSSTARAEGAVNRSDVTVINSLTNIFDPWLDGGRIWTRVLMAWFSGISVSEVPIDFGDAPDRAFGTAPGDYRTRLIDNGARHEIIANLYLGAGVDAEVDSFVNSNHLSGDDDTENGDDGITFTSPLRAGLDASATVKASNTSGSTAYLHAWIDFDGNGNFNGTGEQIAADLVVLSGYTQLDFVIPTDALIGTTYARFRYSSQSALGPNGLATSGEVEDYQVLIEDK